MTEWPARICQPEPGPGYPGETPHDASVQVAGSENRQVPVAQRSSLRQSALARAGTSARRTQTPRTAGVRCPDAGLAAGPGPARLADDSPTDTMSPSGLARTAGRVEVLSGGPATSSGGCLKSVPESADHTQEGHTECDRPGRSTFQRGRQASEAWHSNDDSVQGHAVHPDHET